MYSRRTRLQKTRGDYDKVKMLRFFFPLIYFKVELSWCLNVLCRRAHWFEGLDRGRGIVRVRGEEWGAPWPPPPPPPLSESRPLPPLLRAPHSVSQPRTATHQTALQRRKGSAARICHHQTADLQKLYSSSNHSLLRWAFMNLTFI